MLASRRPEQLVRFGDDGPQNDIAFRSFGTRRPGFELFWRSLFNLLGKHRLFGTNFFCRLVLTQSLEGGLANHSVGGPTREFNLGDQLWLDPGDVFASA